MDLLTALLFEDKGEVCGCPAFWGVGGTVGPDGLQLPGSYFQHHRIGTLQDNSIPSGPEIAYSPPEILTDKPSSQPATTTDSRHRIPQSNISGSLSPSVPSRYDLYSRSPTPSGPPKETCFFWYHGECRRGDKCDRVHKTHITWPIPPPPRFVHWQPCHLPLCPMKEGMEELMSGNENPGDGRVSPSTFGSNVCGADIEIVPGTKKKEKSSTTALENEDDGEIMTAQTGNEDLTKPSPFLGDEIDVISLSSGSCSSTATSPSPPLSNHKLGPSPPPYSIDDGPGLKIISHVGTHKHLHSSKRKPSTLANASHLLITTLEPTQLTEITSVAERRPRPPQSPDRSPKGTLAIETAGKLPKGHLPKERVCFFWYHQGYCRPRRGVRCPCLHTLDTGVKEISLPVNLKFHRLDCELSLCPVRLLHERRQDIIFAGKEEQEAMKDFHQSITPEINYAPQSQVKAAPKRRRMHPERGTFRQVRDRYADQKANTLQRYGTPPEGQNIGNPNLMPLLRKRKVSMPESKSSIREVKRMRPFLLDVVKERHCKFKDPAFVPEFLAESTVHSRSQVKVITAQLGVLVDYVLPSGEDRADWDSDSLRRAFGEIQ